MYIYICPLTILSLSLIFCLNCSSGQVASEGENCGFSAKVQVVGVRWSQVPASFSGCPNFFFFFSVISAKLLMDSLISETTNAAHHCLLADAVSSDNLITHVPVALHLKYT